LKELLSKFEVLKRTFSEITMIQDEATRSRRLRLFNDTLELIKSKLRKKSIDAVGPVLAWEFSRGRLVDHTDDWYDFNAYEVKSSNLRCEMHHLIKAGRFRKMEVGMEFKYRTDPAAGKPFEMYTVFHSFTIPSVERVKDGVQEKIKMGISPTESDYKGDLERVDRIILSEPEWRKHFRHIDDVDLDSLGVKADPTDVLENLAV